MIADKRDFRLDKAVRPSRYELRFDLDLDGWISTGEARIDLDLAEACTEITLHAVDLEITAARVEGASGPSSAIRSPLTGSVSYESGSQTATVRFPEQLPAGPYVLELAWTGTIREALRGLYRSTHGGHRYAATQFEAADARRAFPCFDEPEFKARFAIELVHDASLTAIGNAPIAQQELLPDGRQRTTFAELPRISTYLVAFTVGPYESTPESATPSGVPVRVWLPPGLSDKGGYARDAHVHALDWLEQYTAIPYPYTKLDGIGIPDFEAGAMENPGAITYRTTLLAADPATASTAAFKRIYSVVAHELTHMWWGDLVTMLWWNDLWLNESFASFVGEMATDALNPEWGYIRDIASQATPAFNLDQLVSTHPISMEVANADQASERFDAITYLKGMAVLRMIESFIGADAFRGGVRIYLNRHAEGNATADDFWRALDEASGRDVSAIANGWIREPGHPLVTCTLENTTGAAMTIRVQQSRFFADPTVPATGQSWLVPVVVKYGTADGIREERILMDRAEATITLPGARWYLPNAGGRGFYRYALDDASLTALAGAAAELAAEERLMLVDNYWALTRAGKTSLQQLVVLLAGLQGETDRAVLDAVADPLAWMATHVVPAPGAGADAADVIRAFERFVADFFQPMLAELGWDVRPGDKTEDRERRARAMSMLGRVANSPEVQTEARRRIDAYLDGSLVLDPDVASALAGVAAARGDAALYDRYVARMQAAESTDAQEEGRFRNALVAFEDPSLVQRTVEACFGDLIRTQDRGLLLFSLLGSRHARAITWPVVRDHWDADIAPLDPGLRHRIVNAIGQLTPRDLEREAAAFLQEKETPDSVEVTAQSLERMRLAANAAERLAAELADALRRVEA